MLSPLHLNLNSFNMVVLALPSSLTFHLFRFRFIQLILLLSLILENHTFREGSDNDRPRQHRDINQSSCAFPE